MPLLRGDRDDREVVVGQYLAEGAVSADRDVPQGLVEAHPLTRGPRPAVRPGHRPPRAHGIAPTTRPAAEVLAGLRAAVAERWDLERIDREVHEEPAPPSGRGRGEHRTAPPAWDYAPPYDASRRYIRNHSDLGDLEAIARYPAVRHARFRDPSPERRRPVNSGVISGRDERGGMTRVAPSGCASCPWQGRRAPSALACPGPAT